MKCKVLQEPGQGGQGVWEGFPEDVRLVQRSERRQSASFQAGDEVCAKALLQEGACGFKGLNETPSSRSPNPFLLLHQLPQG